MVHLKSIWESIWGMFGVHLGSILGPCGDLTATLAPDPLGTRFLGPWDRSLRFSWTPCWHHVGSMLEAVGRLEASLGVSGPI